MKRSIDATVEYFSKHQQVEVESKQIEDILKGDVGKKEIEALRSGDRFIDGDKLALQFAIFSGFHIEKQSQILPVSQEIFSYFKRTFTRELLRDKQNAIANLYSLLEIQQREDLKNLNEFQHSIVSLFNDLNNRIKLRFDNLEGILTLLKQDNSCPLCGSNDLNRNVFKCSRCEETNICRAHFNSQKKICDRCAIDEKIIVQTMDIGGLLSGAPHVFERFNIEFQWVAPGSFIFGRNRYPSTDKSIHEFEIKFRYAFWIGTTPITQIQYYQYRKGKWFDWEYENHPMVNVSWDDASKYCQALSLVAHKNRAFPENYEYRLPTEEEWEYAAQGGKHNEHFFFSGAESIDDVGWNKTSGIRSPQEVKKKKSNALGLYDLTGNVWEWCADAWKNPSSISKERQKSLSQEIETPRKVKKGGSWRSAPEDCFVSNRDSVVSSFASDDIGFRCCLGPRLELLRKGIF